MTRQCSEPECDRTDLSGRGLCSRHYQLYRYQGILDEVAPTPKRKRDDCAICGAPLTSDDPKTIYCSRECNQEARKRRAWAARVRIRETCEQCGIELPHEMRAHARFCSPECSHDFHNAQKSAARWARTRRDRKPCKHCGGPIGDDRFVTTMFCSVKCKMAERQMQSYGLTREEYDALFIRQAECCAICGATKAGGRGRFHIDHDHDTGKVRGLLCHKCNVGVGHFDDDPARLRAAADYLERPLD